MEEAHRELGWDRDDEDPELVAYANEVFDSYMEDWIEYCAIPQMKTRKQIRKTLFVTTS